MELRKIQGEPLYGFLQVLLGKLMSKEEVEKCLKPEGYKIFRKGFTHKSAHENENYEVLELLGDSKLEAAFQDYLYHKFPHVTSPAVFTTLVTHYLSKAELARISESFGFPKYLMMNKEYHPSVEEFMTDKEDVFEAFIGALAVVCDMQLQRHMGNVYVAEFVQKVFDKENVDVKDYQKYKTNVSVLKEIYDCKGFGQVRYTQTQTNNGFYVSIVKDGVTIGTGQDKIVKNARESAAGQAIEHLKRLGITKKSSCEPKK